MRGSDHRMNAEGGGSGAADVLGGPPEQSARRARRTSPFG